MGENNKKTVNKSEVDVLRMKDMFSNSIAEGNKVSSDGVVSSVDNMTMSVSQSFKSMNSTMDKLNKNIEAVIISQKIDRARSSHESTKTDGVDELTNSLKEFFDKKEKDEGPKSGIFKGLFKGIKGAGGMITAALGGLSTVLMGGGLIASVIGLAVTGDPKFGDSIKKLLYKKFVPRFMKAMSFNKLEKALKKPFAKLGRAFRKGITRFSDLFDKFGPKKFKGAFRNLGTRFATTMKNLPKNLSNTVSKSLRGVGKKLRGVGRGIGKMIGGNFVDNVKHIQKVMGKGVKTAGKGFKTFLKGSVGKVFGNFGKLFSGVFKKSGGKGLTKVLGKVGSKGLKGAVAVMKNIPILGTLVGAYFAIKRFKDGDIMGGMIEIGSALADVVPVIGTPIGLALDAYQIFRDVKGDDFKAKQNKGMMDKVGGLAKKGWSAMEGVPLLGGIVNIVEGIKMFGSGKKMDGLKIVMKGISRIAPVGAGIELLGKVAGFVGGLFGGKDNIKVIKTETKSDPTGGDFAPEVKTGGGLKNFLFGSKDGSARSGEAFNDGYVPNSTDGFSHDALSFHPTWKTNINGMNKATRSKFIAMASAYMDATGNRVRVNSAKRDGFNQSSHNKGNAIDIQSADANELEKLGLLGEYGFHRPLLKWKSTSSNPKAKNEPWHIEPFPGQKVYGNKRNALSQWRISQLMDGKNSKTNPWGGDEYANIETAMDAATPKRNIPQGQIQKPQKETGVTALTEDTIEYLAVTMAKRFVDALPKNENGEPAITINGRS